MIKSWTIGYALVAGLVVAAASAGAKQWKVLSEQTLTGFGHIESVGYDPQEKVFYTGDFGQAMKPAEKDGKGKITKFSLDGKILQDGVFPAHGEVMNKPKGIWIAGGHLWVTDIDALWEFDLASKKSKRLPLPITYANDVAILGGALYVGDNRSDTLIRIEPVDFLNGKADPKITTVFAGEGVYPNGLWPMKDGCLLMVGFQAKDKPKGIYVLNQDGKPKEISKNIGLLDGLYQTAQGDILVTDWVSGTLFAWDDKAGVQKIADGFKGPADFAAVPNDKGLLVAVPDLVKGEVRLIQLSR